MPSWQYQEPGLLTYTQGLTHARKEDGAPKVKLGAVSDTVEAGHAVATPLQMEGWWPGESLEVDPEGHGDGLGVGDKMPPLWTKDPAREPRFGAAAAGSLRCAWATAGEAGGCCLLLFEGPRQQQG